MSTIASQITSLAIVYSIVYSDADQRKHQSSASLAFVWGIHRGPVNSPHKWPVTRKRFPFDDVIMPVLWVYSYIYMHDAKLKTSTKVTNTVYRPRWLLATGSVSVWHQLQNALTSGRWVIQRFKKMSGPIIKAISKVGNYTRREFIITCIRTVQANAIMWTYFLHYHFKDEDSFM